MAYSEKVINHYENPRNVGSFDDGDEKTSAAAWWVHRPVAT